MLRLVPRISDETPEALIAAGLPGPLSRVLWARGVRTAGEARAFLKPDLSQLHDPFLLSGMDAAAGRVRQALDAGERIVVYGDYDVDGVCGTALLVEALRARGADADAYIPLRHRDGYGLNEEAVRALAERADLLITVDCGITSVREADIAKSLGLDLIITDHHEPPEKLPDALAIINPLLGAYPFRRLCGAGVAFKLLQALFGLDAVLPALDLVALATVADLVPLLGENRTLVHEGLARMQNTARVGLKALLSVAGIEGRALTAGHMGFQIGPRINAGGRLSDASRSVELLLTDDPALAGRIAGALNEENAARQRMEAEILLLADAQVRENVDFLSDKAIVAVGEGWNAGVVGLVASKLAEKYGWPAVVLSESGGVCVGSARSIPGVNLHAALSRCEDLFLRFGGHAQAAGLTLKSENLPAFRERLNKAIEAVAEKDAFIPSAQYDLPIRLADVTIPLVEQLERLAPMGFGNPSPVFLLSDAGVIEARTVGADRRHLKLRFEQDGAALDGIAFGQGAQRAGLPERVDALFSPAVNEFMGRRTAQCEITRLLPHAPEDAFRAECLARADDFDCHLLDTAPQKPGTADAKVLRAIVADALTLACQGTLLVARTLPGALAWVDWLKEAGLSGRLDYCFHRQTDERRFNALCALPEAGAAEGFRRVIALDDLWIAEAARAFLPSDDDLRALYRALRAGEGRFLSESSLAEAAGLRLAAVRLGLRVFDELGLVDYRPAPFAATLKSPVKCDLQSSATLRSARRLTGREEGA